MTLNNSGWDESGAIYPWDFGGGTRDGGNGGTGVNYGGKPQIGLPSDAQSRLGGSAINTGRGSPAMGMPAPGPAQRPTMLPPRQGIPQNTNAQSVGGTEIPNFNGRNKQGQATYSDPNVRWQDRLGRGAKGALSGYDTGSRVGNAAVNVGTAATGLGAANRVAGAVQGLASDKPVNRTWKGGTFDPTAPGPSVTGSNVKNVPTASQTALQQTLSGGANAPDIHRPHQAGVGGLGDDDSYVTYPEDPNRNMPRPARPPGAAPAPGGPPARTGPGLPGTVPAGPDPDGIEAPQLGTPQGDAALDYLYQQYYGRNATPEEKLSHRDNPGGLDSVAEMLADDEANHVPTPEEQEAAAGKDALKQILTGGQHYQTDGSNGRIGVAGAGGGYEFAGFDFAQDPANRDIGKSAKYAFSHLAGQAAGAGAPQPRTKAEAEAWFTQHIKPGMDALGFTVHKVQGDKAFISAPEHPDGAWVDFVINADGGGATPLAWQAELGGAGGDANPETLFGGGFGGGGGVSGMDRGEEGLGSTAVGGVLDSGNKPLDSFAQRLIQQLLEGAALDDAVGREQRATRGITPQGLASVGF